MRLKVADVAYTLCRKYNELFIYKKFRSTESLSIYYYIPQSAFFSFFQNLDSLEICPLSA
jgi:hypothetical protein